MKKYITTDKHPELKEGIVISLYSEGHSDGNRYSTNQGLYILTEYQLMEEIRMNYLKEIQEPKWTDDDMTDFVKYCEAMKFTTIYEALDAFKKDIS